MQISVEIAKNLYRIVYNKQQENLFTSNMHSDVHYQAQADKFLRPSTAETQIKNSNPACSSVRVDVSELIT